MCLIGRSESYLTLRNREDMGALSGECSFIGQRHYTGFSGEILGRYGHDTGAYPFLVSRDVSACHHILVQS